MLLSTPLNFSQPFLTEACLAFELSKISEKGTLLMFAWLRDNNNTRVRWGFYFLNWRLIGLWGTFFIIDTCFINSSVEVDIYPCMIQCSHVKPKRMHLQCIEMITLVYFETQTKLQGDFDWVLKTLILNILWAC